MHGKGTNDEWISSISWKVNNDETIFYQLWIWSDDEWISSISWQVNNDETIFYRLWIWSDDQWVKWW